MAAWRARGSLALVGGGAAELFGVDGFGGGAAMRLVEQPATHELDDAREDEREETEQHEPHDEDAAGERGPRREVRARGAERLAVERDEQQADDRLHRRLERGERGHAPEP